MDATIHQNQPLERRGASLPDAQVAVLLLHGRGASARSILGLADELPSEGVAYLAPQAARHAWYPHSFMAPIEQNEPALTSALRRIGAVMEEAASAGLPASQTVLIGFSQGACLATEYVARHPQRYGGVVGLSGGLIGPEDAALDPSGSLSGTPVFLGCSDQDPYIPLERVQDTADALQAMHADVDLRVYPGMGHTVNDDELQAARALVARRLEDSRA